MRREDDPCNHEETLTTGVTVALPLKSGLYSFYKADSCSVHVNMEQQQWCSCAHHLLIINGVL
jgi:hypothetical protein